MFAYLAPQSIQRRTGLIIGSNAPQELGIRPSMRMKYVDLIASYVHQDARDVRTKFSKTLNAYFFLVGMKPSGLSRKESNLREEKL
jgi:hypothetical protein